MRVVWCGFLIIKSQIALHHVVRCSVLLLARGVVMPFWDQFWCGLVNTPTYN